jgi:hypothetical protein
MACFKWVVSATWEISFSPHKYGWRSVFMRKLKVRKRADVTGDEKSEIFVVLRKQGNACGGKGD